MRYALLLPAMLASVVNSASAAVVAVDASGGQVTLAAPARRVISLAPHATELLFAAGAGDDVVGVLSPADWPPEAANRPRVGDSGAINLEGILALRPDLVVTWPYLAPTQVERLRAMGIPVYLSNPRTVDAIAGDIERLGALTGHVDVSGRTAAAFRTRVAAARDRVAGTTRVRVFYEIWHQPLMTINGDHMIDDVIRRCGGSNIFANVSSLAPLVSLESVIARRPDVVLGGSSATTPEEFAGQWTKYADYAGLTGVRAVYIDPDYIQRQTPRILKGAQIVCESLERVRAARRPRQIAQ